MNDVAKLLVLAILTGAAKPANTQSISLDNVAPFPLLVSTSTAAISINPSSGNVTARSLAGTLSQCAGSTAFGADKSVLGGNTGLQINGSGRINLQMTPIDYFNRTVFQGRRVLSLRLAQPLLCFDFQPTPSAAVNPVGLRFIDANNETNAVIYGGITGYNYLTNGGGNSTLVINAGAQLACCTMLPGPNASCFQGNNGGLSQPAGALPASAKGGATNLSVSLSGPPGVLPGGTLIYSIVVHNNGASGISGIRVRDWYTKNTSGQAANFSAGSWNCAPSAGADCGSNTSGSGNVALTNVTLSAGSSVVLTVSRTLGAFATLGTPYSLSAAAFAPPLAGETNLGDNQGILTGIASVQDVMLVNGFE